MYEYPELNSINAMDTELFKVLEHDSLLHQCYSNYAINYNSKPFDYKKFYVYLSYMALKTNQHHMKLCIANAERSIDPPIFIRVGEDIYSKAMIDKVVKYNKKKYWQKLWEAILGR